MIEWSLDEVIPPDLVWDFERLAKVVLPDDYKAVVVMHDGAGLPDGKCLMVPDSARAEARRPVNLHLLPFSTSPQRLSIGEMLGIGWRRIPGLVAFAVDEVNNEFAFDYNNDGSRPKIVYIDRRDGDGVHVVHVADDFSALLDAVQPDPDRVVDDGETQRWLRMMGVEDDVVTTPTP